MAKSYEYTSFELCKIILLKKILTWWFQQDLTRVFTQRIAAVEATQDSLLVYVFSSFNWRRYHFWSEVKKSERHKYRISQKLTVWFLRFHSSFASSQRCLMMLKRVENLQRGHCDCSNQGCRMCRAVFNIYVWESRGRPVHFIRCESPALNFVLEGLKKCESYKALH